MSQDIWTIKLFDSETNQLAHIICDNVIPPASWADGYIIRTKTTKADRTGIIKYLIVYKNATAFSKLSTPYDNNNQILNKGEIVSPVAMWISPNDYLQPIPSKIVCTCGGWAVYGKEADIHCDDRVNQCDLRRYNIQ